MKTLMLLGCIFFALNLSGFSSGVNGWGNDKAGGKSKLFQRFPFNVFNCLASFDGGWRKDSGSSGPACVQSPMTSLQSLRACLRKEGSKLIMSSSNCYNNISANVPCLGFRGSPPAVAGFVVAVIIYSVNGAFFYVRLFPNILKKLLKRVVKKIDSSSSISRILWVGRVLASSFSFLIRAVFLFMPCGQCSSSVPQVDSVLTPATNNPSGVKVACGNSVYFSAFALAIPIRCSPPFYSSISQYRKIVNHFSCLVNEIVVVRQRCKHQFSFFQYTHYTNENAYTKGYPTSKTQVGNRIGRRKIVGISRLLGSSRKIQEIDQYNCLKTNKIPY